MVVADLHVHTTNSDGALALGELPAAAEEAGLDAVAVTDHDRIHPELGGPVTALDGLTVVHGVELRARADGRDVDLLGYGVSPTDRLRAEIERLQADRIERAREMVTRLERRLGVSLAVEFGPGVGRPHIARAIAESDADYTVAGAFEHLIGEDCPCYVGRDLPEFDRARDLLAEACGLVALAHPLRYDDPERALALAADLDAVERRYPYEGTVDHRPVDRAIRRHGLTATGGSDAHERTLGVSGLDRAAYRRFRAALDP